MLGILAGENKLLAKLSLDSDQALAPFAAVRERVADYIVQQNTVATATARHNKELAENFAAFPAFLRQFGPAMERIGKFADETTPTFTDLKAAAPGINGIFTNLVPFQKSSTKFFVSLGKTAQVSGPAIAATKPLLERVQKLGSAAKPFAGNFRTALQPAEYGRPRAAARPDLPGWRQPEWVRLARPLRARRDPRQELRRLQGDSPERL